MTDIDFFLETFALKDEKRTGWELRNIESPESVAGHTWGTALLCLVYGNKENIDVNRCIKMALVHDLAEYETGDLVTRADSEMQEIEKNDKHDMEQLAMKQLGIYLESQDLLDLWNEYEERETKESKFVKDMDLIDMCLTALKYEKEGRYDKEEDNENFNEYSDLDEFFATSKPRLNTETGKDLFQQIKQKYEEAKQE